MSQTQLQRRAFTLVELLVVIAIIGILIALLLPAVQAAREAARRSQCTNNIKQLVLGCHNYHDVHKCFPVNQTHAWVWFENERCPSWLVGLLPFIEQKNLHDGIDFGVGVGSAANPTVNTPIFKTVVPAFLCPSDSHDDGLMNNLHPNQAVPTEYWPVTCYASVMGNNWGFGDAVCRYTPTDGRWVGQANGIDYGNGVMCRNNGNLLQNVTQLTDIKDGTSNTFAVGESVPAWCSLRWWYPCCFAVGTCGIPLNYESVAIRADPNDNITLESQRHDYPNNLSFSSRHPGGANFAMADGSVTFVSDTIDLAIYRYLASIDEGIPASLP